MRTILSCRAALAGACLLAVVGLAACSAHPAGHLAGAPASRAATTPQATTPQAASAAAPGPTSSATGSTPPAATPARSAAASPTADAAIEVYGDCTSPSLEPTAIIVTCADDGWVVQDIVWTSWTSTAATAVATLVYDDCSPSCAEGHFHQVPDTRLTLTDPVPDIDGQLVWSRLTENPWPPGYTTGPLQGAPYPLPTRPI